MRTSSQDQNNTALDIRNPQLFAGAYFSFEDIGELLAAEKTKCLVFTFT